MKLCGFDVGLERPLFLIAGPCVVESRQLQMDVAGQLKAENVKNVDEFKAPPSDGQGVLILALPNHRDDLRAIEPQVPGGEERDVLAPNGRLLYHVYEVMPTR